MSLFKNLLYTVPTRLRRMMLKIQSYLIIVKYDTGKLMVLANT